MPEFFLPHYHKLRGGSVTPQIVMCVSGLGGEIRLDETLLSPTGDQGTNLMGKQRNKAEQLFF